MLERIHLCASPQVIGCRSSFLGLVITRVLLVPFEKATIANVDKPVPSQSSSLTYNTTSRGNSQSLAARNRTLSLAVSSLYSSSNLCSPDLTQNSLGWAVNEMPKMANRGVSGLL